MSSYHTGETTPDVYDRQHIRVIKQQFSRRCAKGKLGLRSGLPFPFAVAATPNPKSLHLTKASAYQTVEEGFTNAADMPCSTKVFISYAPPQPSPFRHDRYHCWTAVIHNPGRKCASSLCNTFQQPLASVFIEEQVLRSPYGKKIVTDKRILQKAFGISVETGLIVTITDRNSTMSNGLQPDHPSQRSWVFIGTYPSGRQEILGYVG